MKFKVDGYQITRTDHENVITTSNVESVVCEFEFSDTYTDQLFAIMYRDESLNRMVEIQNGSCVIPWELLETEGMLYIGACALSTQGPTVLKRTTSNAVAIRIQKSLYYDTVLNATPTPELWEQIVGYRNETKTYAEQAAEDAESAAQSAKQAQIAEENAVTATDEAYGYAEQAGESAEAAGQSAQSAESSAALAEQYKSQAQAIKDSTEIFYDVQTNKVGFKRANEASFAYTGDLTGPQGAQGIQGPQGVSGVYVGSGEMPEGYNVQIDPNGSGSCYMAGESDARYANAITGEATGKVANLTDAWAGGVLSKCEISGQEAGITPAKVTVCGKNLAVSSRFLGEEASPGCVYAECELEPNTTYTFSLYVPAGEKYYTNEYLGTYVTKPVSTGEVLSYTVTTLEELSKENKSQYVNRYGWQLFKNSPGYSSSGNARDLQVELGDTATAYEPYAGIEYPLPELAPLYSLNDVCDTYDAATGVETRRIGKDEDGSLYELESPVITQHDPVAITVPAVTANIFADAGEVSVTYTKDTNLVIATDSRYANAITGETSGTLVTLSDAWVGGVLSKCKLSDSTAQLVYITGKNLLDPSLLKGNGTADLALQDDGTLILNGTDSSKNTTFYHPDHPIYLPAGEYRISLNTVSGSYSSPDDVIYFGMRKTDGSTALSNQLTNSVSSKSFRFVSTGLYYYFYIVGKFVCTDWRISIQIEPGTVTTPYEQYVGAEYATNALNSITVPKTEAIVRADAGEVSVTYTKDTNKVITALTERIAALEGGNQV